MNISISKYGAGRRLWLAIAVAMLPLCGFAMDWDEASQTDLHFFFPGTATWERVLSQNSHSGAKGVRGRVSCVSCHEGEEMDMASAITGDSKHAFYRNTKATTYREATLQIARDATQIALRITVDEVPVEQPLQLSLLLDDGAFESSALSGCWASCHDDTRVMPSAGKRNLTKYLSRSRNQNTRTGGGENYKSSTELKALVSSGEFLELLGVRVVAGMPQVIQGYILERRHDKTAAGSASVGYSAEGAGGRFDITRPLASDSATVKKLVPGGIYSVAFALHVGEGKGANHLVTFPVRFQITKTAIELVQGTH